MYAITGISGKVGGHLANHLIAGGYAVRAIVRDAAKGAPWAARGAETAVAAMADAGALTAAFAGAEAVFILPPPVFDPAPGYPEARRNAAAVTQALRAVKPARVVLLSTIGADAGRDNLLSQATLMEDAVRETGLPLTILRPGWFMDNTAWDVASARDTGVIASFLSPLDRGFPMVATRDVGAMAARLMTEPFDGARVVELTGPAPVSADDIAAAFAAALGRPVRVQAVPRAEWEPLFRAQGMRNPEPRIRMLDGFNAGWIAFRDGGAQAARGATEIGEVVAALCATSQGRSG